MLNIGTTLTDNLVVAWKGVPGDDQLYYSQFDGSNWMPFAQIPGLEGSSTGPSLAGFNGLVYVAFKGAGSDESLYYTSFDGSNWAPQQAIPGAASSVGPSLAGFNGLLYAAWKGAGWDESLYYTSFDGSNWAPQQAIPGESSVGPSLAVLYSQLYAAWVGANADDQVWYSSFDGSSWAPQQVIPGAASMTGASLTWFNVDGNLYAAWRDATDDENLFYTSFDGSNWATPAAIPGASSIGPSLTAFNDQLYAVWVGANVDDRVWYSSFDGSNWAPQQVVPGAGSGFDPPSPPSPGLLPPPPPAPPPPPPESMYVFHIGSGGNNLQIWYTTFDNTSWSADTQLQNVSLTGEPGAVSWAGNIMVFHQGWNADVGPDGNIWYSVSPDGVNWNADTLLPAAQQGIQGSPSPVGYNDDVYVFYLYGAPAAGFSGFPDPGTGIPPPEAKAGPEYRLPSTAAAPSPTAGPIIYAFTYSYWDGSTWYGPYQVPNVPLGVVGPLSPVNWLGGIAVFYQGSDSNYNPDGSLWYVYSPDGINWGQPTLVPNVGVSKSPSALVYNNSLYVFHQGYGDNEQLWYSVFDGTNWAPDTLITTSALSFAPSAVVWNGGIAVLHQGGGDDEDLWYVYSADGVNWSGDMQVPNVNLMDGPSAVVLTFPGP